MSSDSTQTLGEDCWGVLISQNSSRKNVSLVGEKHTFGRNPTCQTVFSEDLRFSGNHFHVAYEAGRAWLCDTSMNGTFVNGNKVGKGNKQLLQTYDIISLLDSQPQSYDEMLAVNYVSYTFKYLNNSTEKIEVDVEEFHQKYALTHQFLGEGSHADVWLVKDKASNGLFAMKRMKNYKKGGLPGRMNKTEIEIMTKMDHPLVIKLYDVYRTSSHIYMVMEYARGGELFDRIQKSTFYTEDDAKECSRQIVKAIDYLHSQRVVHRDLKPENILLVNEDSNYDIKITDFGLSRILEDQYVMHTFVGTAQYSAPELIQSETSRCYTQIVDEWSIGTIIYTLLSGYPPFHEEKPTPIHIQILSADYDFPSEFWGEVSDTAIDLVKRFLVVDPSKRITCAEALVHPWLREQHTSHTAHANPSSSHAKRNIAEQMRRSYSRGILGNQPSEYVDMVGEFSSLCDRGLKRESSDTSTSVFKAPRTVPK